ncbi:Chloroperoxidase, partial [Clohesyomyces aquaticus]
MMLSPPKDHPEVDFDWSKWDPAGEGDVRSPCPMINSLANHHILPHNGKHITKAQIISVLTHALNLDPKIASVFASVALSTNPHRNQKDSQNENADHDEPETFDLDHLSTHGPIEHDVSLSRSDYNLGNGDNHTFNPTIFSKVLAVYTANGATETSFESMSRARWERVLAAKKAHEEERKTIQYGVKEFVLSYGESALVLGIIGGKGKGREGKVRVEWVRVLFEEERVPHKEGWSKPESPLTQMDMNHLIAKLVAANEQR